MMKLLSINPIRMEQQRAVYDFAARFQDDSTGRVHVVPLKPPELRSYAQLCRVVLQSTGRAWASPEHRQMSVTEAQRAWQADVEAFIAKPQAPSPQDFLRAILERGETRARAILDAGMTQGISEGRIQRAARKLGVQRRREGRRGVSLWALPAPIEQREGIAA